MVDDTGTLMKKYVADPKILCENFTTGLFIKVHLHQKMAKTILTAAWRPAQCLERASTHEALGFHSGHWLDLTAATSYVQLLPHCGNTEM